MNRAHRVLVIAHGHPDFSFGGGELAAYHLFQALRSMPEVEHASFVARIDRGRPATGQITLRRPDEYLWEQGISDWHLLKAAHRESLTTWFADLVQALRPTIVFAHHYAHLGLEYLRVLRRLLPAARIVLTLHEFMAICANDGQMVKTRGRGLCRESGLEDCHRCFPERSPESFWLRDHFVRHHLAVVDQFVAPSAFLRQRYVQWGLPPQRVEVIDNGQEPTRRLPPRPLERGETRNRFAFFGQINPFKGVLVLLEALHLLPPDADGPLLEVHGANLELQSGEFRARFEALSRPLVEQGRLTLKGPYARHELPHRLACTDWVVVPSTWWENSPLVIQEAFAHGRPVLCSGIGGMAEKVRDDVDGRHVPAGDVQAWAAALRQASRQVSEWEALYRALPTPQTHEQCARAYLNLVSRGDAARGWNDPARGEPTLRLAT